MGNLNVEAVKKALECCHSYALSDCANCGYKHKGNDEIYASCVNFLVADALALITSQEERIKELTEENERLRANAKSATEILNFQFVYGAAKADTVREMQERFNEKVAKLLISPSIRYQASAFIDQIAKEMVEGEK